MSRRNDVDDADRGTPRSKRRGQPRSRRSRHSVAERVAAWTSVVVVAVLVAGTLVAYGKYRSIWDSIKRIDVAGLVGNQPPKLNNAENILLIGSDTLMLLHISPGNHDVTVVSIPRETMVPIISCPAVDGTTGQQAEPGEEEL